MNSRRRWIVSALLCGALLTLDTQGQPSADWNARMESAHRRAQSGGDSGLVAELELLAAESERFSATDRRRLFVRQTLGLVYHAGGRLLDARRQLESAVCLADTYPGEASVEKATSLIMLAALHLDLGQIGKGEKALLLSKEILRPHRDTHLAHLARIDLLLAKVLAGRERLNEAEALLRESLKLADTSGNRLHGETVFMWNLLGMIHLQREDWQAASGAFSRAVELGVAEWGADHPNSAKASINLACSLRRLGRPADAEAVALRAQQAIEARFGSDHPGVGAALMERAEALRDLKRDREAKPLKIRAQQLLRLYETSNHIGATMDIDVLSVRARK